MGLKTKLQFATEEDLAHVQRTAESPSAATTPEPVSAPLVGTGEFVGLASRETVEALVSLRNAATIRETRLRCQLTGVIRKIREERVKIAAWNEAIAAAEAVAQRGEPNIRDEPQPPKN